MLFVIALEMKLKSFMQILVTSIRGPKMSRPRRFRRTPADIFGQREMLKRAFAATEPRAYEQPIIPIDNGRGCTLLELGERKCRWPINDPGSNNFCFCGNEPVKGLPYCLGHTRIAYRSVGRQRSSSRETR